MDGINGDNEHPDYKTKGPCIGNVPEAQYQLSSSKIGGDRDSIIEPIVPRECESVSWGEKPGSIGIEGSWVFDEKVRTRRW